MLGGLWPHQRQLASYHAIKEMYIGKCHIRPHLLCTLHHKSHSCSHHSLCQHRCLSTGPPWGVGTCTGQQSRSRLQARDVQSTRICGIVCKALKHACNLVTTMQAGSSSGWSRRSSGKGQAATAYLNLANTVSHSCKPRETHADGQAEINRAGTFARQHEWPGLTAKSPPHAN
jgi:hypothetical protein